MNNTEIKIADSTRDFEGIREIWDEQFPADLEYQETVFSKILPLCKTYIIVQNDDSADSGKVLSIASLMPMNFIDTSAENRQRPVKFNGWYMFGVATRGGFMGKGLASALLKHIISNESINNYSFIFERPANQHLIDFYLKFGFTKLIKKKNYRFDTINSNFKESKNAEYVINKLKLFPKRFEWESAELLESLIALGEIERHQELLTPESLQEECYIAVKPLNDTPESLFDDAFFCFPLE